jgi:hypothetical protein
MGIQPDSPYLRFKRLVERIVTVPKEEIDRAAAKSETVKRAKTESAGAVTSAPEAGNRIRRKV